MKVNEAQELIGRLQRIAKGTRPKSERGQMVRLMISWLEMAVRGEEAPLPMPLLIQRARAGWNLY